MSYFGELRQNIRPLVAASLGAGVSLPFYAYTNTVFSPFLVKEFGWSRSQFALVGLTMLASLAVLPVVGRFTDRIGVRKIALIGTLTTPLAFLAYAAQQGSFLFFLLCNVMVLCFGCMSSPLVYSRLIAERFTEARGLALTIMNCVPALLAIPTVPLLNWTIEHVGWRTGYLGLAALILTVGLVALALIPADSPAETEGATARMAEPVTARRDYGVILKSKTFWIIFIGFFLCMLQTPLHAAQMNIMLMDNGLTTQGAANIGAIYALGTIIGRITCGLALDRYSTPVVTWISLGLPAIGYCLLASSLDTAGIITFAMFLIGMSVGAESDLMPFLNARYFKLRIFNTSLGLFYVCSFAAAAIGAIAISTTLRLTDSFTPYLFLVSGSIAIGSLLFLTLPRGRQIERIG